MLAALVGVYACGKRDEDLAIDSPREALAANGYAHLSASDACEGGGKVNVCSTENVVEITSYGTSDPSIVEVLLSDEVPVPGWPTYYEPLALAARGAGTTLVRIIALFDDGSEREATAEVTVATAERVTLEHFCPEQGRNPSSVIRADLIPVGVPIHLQARLYAGDTELVGTVPSALSGAPLVHTFPQRNGNYYDLVATEPGPLTIASALDSRVATHLEVYSPDDFDTLTLSRSPSSNSDGDAVLYFGMTIAGELPCSIMRLAVESLTPELCTSRDGAIAWTDVNGGVALVRPTGSGICRLAVSAEGATRKDLVEITFPLTE